MPNKGEQLSTVSIIEMLFDFIKDKFDIFEHKARGHNKWWHSTKYGGSWAPFIEACFINEGENSGYNIGHSFTHSNITDVFRDFFSGRVYDKDHRHQDYKGIDISWRNISEENKSILALENSEDSQGNGSTAGDQLNKISEEIDKLEKNCADFNIIVSRPHLRRIKGRRDSYSDLINYFQNEINKKLLTTNPSLNQKWIIVLIAPEEDLNQHNRQTQIGFHCYEWKTNKLERIPLVENSFCVEMNIGGDIKRC